MIVDARVLQSEFVPNEVVHRDAEINALTDVLDPITRGESAAPVVLHGPSGVGKTCIARYAVERLHESILDVESQYVNCWRNYTSFKLLYRLLEGVGREYDVHRQSTPRDALVDRLHEYDGDPYVVILDEADQLEDTSVLYELHRIGAVTPVLITNSDRELFSKFDERVSSRFRTGKRIRFDRYGIGELGAILRGRARAGLSAGAVGDEQIDRIADEAAGDARVAIGTLREAAREATRRGVDEIGAEIVDAAVPEAKREIRQANVEKLTDDQRVLYDVVRERGEVSPGELYEEYQSRVSDPKTRRTVRKYLQKMDHYNLVRARGENRGRKYLAT